MKKGLFLFVCLLALIAVTRAQLVKKTTSGKVADWFNLSFDKDGVYGAEVNKAYDFLKTKKVKKKPIVALISYGMDIEHEDLKSSIWNNPNEKSDGIDNDNNGFIDDLHGWNFLGNAKGEMVEDITKEGDREFFRLRDKYEGLFFNGTNYMRFDDMLKTPVVATPPADIDEYNYFRKQVNAESVIAKASSSYYFSKFMVYYFNNDLDAAVKKMYPDPSKITGKEYAKINFNSSDSILSVSHYAFVLGMTMKVSNSKAPAITYGDYRKQKSVIEYVETQKMKYEGTLAKMLATDKISGNDFKDINQKNYGNNNVTSNSSFIGTMVAGVIAADRSNVVGVNGIVPDALLMPLRVYPKTGEPYFKDIALAIRYAADNKADIIYLGNPNTLYPAWEAKWVNDALVYAEQKGVLVVSSVWDLSMNISENVFYPNRHIGAEKELNNFMMVAASDSSGKPMSSTNFSAQELDLFAPGVGVATTYLGSTYRKADGSGLAAASVVGVAALVKAYYPSISATQLRTLIMQNVSSRKGVEVEKMAMIKGKRQPITDMFLFEELCTSGGILNAYKTIMAADKLNGGK